MAGKKDKKAVISSNLKVAVITGAARGIGLAIAKRFHAEDYYAIIIDRDKEAMQACQAQLRAKAGTHIFFVMFQILNR